LYKSETKSTVKLNTAKKIKDNKKKVSTEFNEGVIIQSQQNYTYFIGLLFRKDS